MPEGPEVKTVARTLACEMVGHELGELWHSHHRLRAAVDYSLLRRVENTVVDGVSAYGKVLFISVDQKPAIMAQLGMTGQLTVTSTKTPVLTHTHLRWPLKDTGRELRYVDPRRFGLIAPCDEEQKEAIINRLGPDPFLMTDNDYTSVIEAMRRSRRVIKDILLEQSIIVGVGNIYASEALFLAKINPSRAGSDISISEYQGLIKAVVVVLTQALKNCGTTFSNYVDGSGKKGDNLDRK